MCDFCKAAVDPDNDYEEDLICTPLILNNRAKIGFISVGMQSNISNDGKFKPVLFMDMDVSDDSVIYDFVEINYCPICGHKFTN